jgi:phosphoenolpyruvate carboxykinase (ATP)
MGPMKDLEVMEIDGFMPNFSDASYAEQFAARMQDRVQFVQSRDTFKAGFDKLPADALEAISA